MELLKLRRFFCGSVYSFFSLKSALALDLFSADPRLSLFADILGQDQTAI